MSWSLENIPSHLADGVAETLLRLGDSEGAARIWITLHKVVSKRSAADPANTGWQRDLIVIYFKLAEMGDDPTGRYGRALQIARALEDEKRLQPTDAWMIADLERRIGSIGP